MSERVREGRKKGKNEGKKKERQRKRQKRKSERRWSGEKETREMTDEKKRDEL